MTATGKRTLLGFDYGLERIGVAVGQEITGSANPLTTVKSSNGAPDWPAIEKLITEWKPGAFVVGMPFNMDGTEGDMCKKARRFGNQLNGRYNLEVHWIDERLSSLQAERQKNSKHTTDELAAQIILQAWLDEHGN